MPSWRLQPSPETPLALPALALAVAVVVFLSGCAGADPDPEDPGPAPAGTSTSAAPGNDAGPGTGAAPPAATPEPATLAWTGHTKEGAWVCMEQSGLGQCPAGQQVAPDGGHTLAVGYEGSLATVELAMAWQADATQTGLVLAAYGNTSAGRGLLGAAHGDSPLALTLDLAGAGLVPDGVLLLMV